MCAESTKETSSPKGAPSNPSTSAGRFFVNKTRVNAIYQMGWKDIFYHLPKDVLANLNRAFIIKSVKESEGALSNSNTLAGRPSRRRHR